MNRIPAVLHGTGGSPAGEPCQIAFVGDHLLVDAQQSMTIPVDSLTVSMGGFDDDTLFINAEHEGTAISVIVRDRDSQRALLQQAPAGFMPTLRQSHGAVNYHRQKWRAVLGTLAALVLTVLVAWWQSERIVAWAADRVPQKREEQLGRMFLTQIKADGDLRESGPAVDAVKQIGTRLTQGSRYSYQWLVKETNEVNAFAGPGGVVVVYTGLIEKADSPEELAAVLAHEVQHVEHRHVMRSMIHSAGWAALLAVGLGDVSAIAGVLIHQVGNMHHSRQLEAEADRDGVTALVHAGISPNGMTSFFAKLRDEQVKKGNGFDVPLLSSHPATEDRLSAVAEMVKSSSCSCGSIDMDWSAVKADASATVSANDKNATDPDA